jgi:putative nucleotidyltransferase with HDIG domain
MPDLDAQGRDLPRAGCDPDHPLAQMPANATPDWAGTISNLMSLAKTAAASYDYDKAIEYLRTMEEIWDSKGLPEFSMELRFELHKEKGKALASLGKLDKAIAEYQKILDYCRDNTHLTVKCETFTQIGQLMCKQGDHDRALGFLQRALGAYRRLGDKTGICRALRNLGVVYVELGEFEETENAYEEAIALAREIGENILYADLVNNLGTIMNMKGDWKRALDLYRDSLEIYRSHDERRKCAYAQNNIAITLAEKGINDEAFIYFKEAYETATSLKDASLTLIVNINLADLHLKRGETDDARKHCQLAEWYLKESGLVNGNLAETKKLSGKISIAENDHRTALKSFNEAYTICKEIGARYLEAEILCERGTLYRAQGCHLDALADLEASYHLYTTVKADGKREQTEEIIASLERLYLEVFDGMAQQVDRKDPYTKGHSDRVAALALLLAKEVGLKTHMVKTIVAAGLLHDIGKINIDDAILNKPGKLTDAEFHHIKKHPELGVALLRGKEFPWDLRPLILHHHEKIDGTGYPLGLKGEDIPLGARIICIADVFDALTSDRIYRKAFGTIKALEIMNEESGRTFDPVLLKSFVRLIQQGQADPVINSRTRDDEMYSIWSHCMRDYTETTPRTTAIDANVPAK